MQRRRLGRTDIHVSAVCLGTMTWGQQNSEADGHRQMDYALDRGVDFWDTAEMYSVPTRAETYGRTEEIIGSWFAGRGKRDKVILATKAAGPDATLPWIRGGESRFDRANLRAALEGSLRRLKTDYVDLYQLHWPERELNNFGVLAFQEETPLGTDFEETMAALGDLVREGKMRAVGLSNESAWGAMRYLALADQGKGPRMASIQNVYSLLNRSFEVGLSEVAIREQCGLLAFSSLGMGVLSGKYLGGQRPAGARATLFPSYTRYFRTPNAEAAAAAYVKLAREQGLEPAQMALAFVISRPFVTACIIGATTMVQLEADIAAATMKLPDPILKEIEAIHARYTYPCP
jgi:aryl-alcohol dehydrogenase-like predicted oxidoreductase